MLIAFNIYLIHRTVLNFFFFFSSRRRHTRSDRGWSSDVCSSDLAGDDDGDAEAAGNAMQPGMERRVEIAAGARLADRRAFEDEERDGEERDARHLLIDVLRDGGDRGAGHEEQHEPDRDGAQRKGDRHAREESDERRAAIEKADREEAHQRSAGESCANTCSTSCATSTLIPAVISP